MASAPPERGYQQQVQPGGAARFGFATPDQFGANVGAQIAQAGGELERAGLEAHRQELEQRFAGDLADANKQRADFVLQAHQQALDMEANAGPGAAGHSAAYADWYKTQSQALLDGIQNAKVRQRIEPAIEDEGTQLIDRAQTFQATAQGIKHNDDIKTAANLSANTLQLPSATDDTFLSEAQQVHDVIHAGPGTADAKDAADKQMRSFLATSYLDALAERDPQGARAKLDSGAWDGVLGEEGRQKRAISDHIDVETRRQEAEARRQLAERRADAETFLGTITKREENGVPIPQEDFDQAQKLLGDPDLRLDGKAFDIGKAQVVDRVNRVYGNSSIAPAQISSRLQELDAQIAKQGDKVPPAVVIERNRLAEILPGRLTEWRDDPLTVYARGGGQVTPIDWTNPDPKAMQARLGEATVAQGRTGTPYLTVLTPEDEAFLEQKLATGGTAGRIDVADTLAKGGQDFALAAARQVGKGNPFFMMATALAAMGPHGAAAARDAILGADAIAAHKTIVRDKAAQEEFGKFADAFTGLTPDVQRGIFDTARGIYATRALRDGRVEWPEFSDDGQRGYFRGAIDQAVGASMRPDGTKQGGVGSHAGHGVVLPTAMTQPEFDRAIARAGIGDFRRASGGDVPVFTNGNSPSLGQFKGLQLEAHGDGRYRVVVSPGTYLLSRAHPGHAYEFDATKLHTFAPPPH